MAFCERLESEEVPQGQLSEFRILHPNPNIKPRYGWTLQDPSLSGGRPASNDSIAQGCGDRDEIEDWASVDHSNARDGHTIQGSEVTISSFVVVELEGRDSTRDNLSLCIFQVHEGLVGNEHQKDGVRVSVQKGQIGSSVGIGFAADRERNDVIGRYDGLTLVEAQEPQRLGGEVNKLSGVSVGESEMGNIFCGGIRNGGVGIAKRRVENGGVDVVERRVRGREEVGWRERRDGDVVRDEVVVVPVPA